VGKKKKIGFYGLSIGIFRIWSNEK